MVMVMMVAKMMKMTAAAMIEVVVAVVVVVVVVAVVMKKMLGQFVVGSADYRNSLIIGLIEDGCYCGIGIKQSGNGGDKDGGEGLQGGEGWKGRMRSCWLGIFAISQKSLICWAKSFR